MKKLVLLFLLICVSCGQTTKELTDNLSGYWNIQKVEFPYGTEKEYPYTTTLDHFTLKDSIGVKNRVTPRYDNVMVSAETPINFRWKEVNGDLVLTFQDGAEAYQQIVKKCTESELILVHDNKTTYHYKRYLLDAQ